MRRWPFQPEVLLAGAIGLVLALALLFGGCGGNDDEETTMMTPAESPFGGGFLPGGAPGRAPPGPGRARGVPAR